MKVEDLFIVEKSYNKTFFDFNFSRHKDLSTLKSDSNLGIAVSVNHFCKVVVDSNLQVCVVF